jgi:hypothetical protein
MNSKCNTSNMHRTQEKKEEKENKKDKKYCAKLTKCTYIINTLD